MAGTIGTDGAARAAVDTVNPETAASACVNPRSAGRSQWTVRVWRGQWVSVAAYEPPPSALESERARDPQLERRKLLAGTDLGLPVLLLEQLTSSAPV